MTKKIMNIKSFVFLCTLCVCLLCACKKDDLAEKWAQEEAILADWIRENNIDAIFDNGIWVQRILKFEDNIKPEAGDHLLVNYKSRFLFNENYIEQASCKNCGARVLPTYKEGGPELWQPLSPSSALPEYRLITGIDNLHEKETAVAYVPSRMLNLQDFITRKIEIELVKVIDDLKTYQEELMRCIMKNFIENVDTIGITDNGREFYVVYHIDDSDGDEVDISSVTTSYSEKYFLENDTPVTCVRLQDRAGADWNNKFSKMFQSIKRGNIITVVMPYRVMYGEERYDDINKQLIAPPGSVLMYEINIKN